MSGAEITVGVGWDAEKVNAHIANLREEHARKVAIYDAFTDAAEDYDREAHRLQQQIAHCLDLFGKPKQAAS